MPLASDGTVQVTSPRAAPAIVSLRVDEAIDCVRDDPAYKDIVRRFDLAGNPARCGWSH
jgi:hypothetical protein